MNLKELYEIQGGLKNHIGYAEKDRFEKLMLALVVEVGECANEWRGFKFWSKDQEPRTKGWNPLKDFNPLLEEYVDGLHLVLEAGLDLLEAGLIDELPKESTVHSESKLTITRKYKLITWLVLQLDGYYRDKHYLAEYQYKQLLNNYIELGEMLGFTKDEIVQAYLDKNKVNHERQINGY